jgi:hypothetical protein
MEDTETLMKKLVAVVIAVAGLAGCVAVPVGEPGVYVAPPSVVVQPYGYYGYYRGYGHRHYY